MYLLLFQAWAQLCGFTYNSINGTIRFNTGVITHPNVATIGSWAGLANVNWNEIYVVSDAFETSPQRALLLANIMTHASLILIFVFVIMFFVFLFRLLSGMLSGRR